MKLQRSVVFLLALVVSALSQDQTSSTAKPEWNGDPRVCTPDSTPSQGPMAYPEFPKKAEFTLEVVQIGHLQNVTSPSILTKLQYLYDSVANILVLVKNDGAVTDVEYYYYKDLTKATYYRGEYCVVTSIPVDVENDGNSAIIGPGGNTTIRPMNEFLLFSRNDPRKPPITPIFTGQAVVRGIAANRWETCIVDKVNRITEKRVWYFAAPGQQVPSANPVRNEAVPLQAEISRSIDDENGTQILELDTVFSVHTFRPGFIETVEQLAPPKGVFCYNAGQTLGSLAEIQVNWPDRFSVRVDASSSRSAQWQRFHLRYNRREGYGRIIRYDYLPPGSQDYRSVIHDYSTNVSYFIDLQTGNCRVRNSLEFFDVSPIRDPIDFFIKHDDIFILNRDDKIWEYNGIRNCRGTSIECSIITGQKLNFPPIVESDTGRPTGETWRSMSMEYAWSTRAPLAPQAEPNRPRGFDYPAHLYLRFYFDNASAIPTGPGFGRNEDVEYEFFEMSDDVSPYDFDVSTCFRANNYDYLHLGFVFTFNNGALDNGNVINRRSLIRETIRTLVRTMRVGVTRVSGLEIDHETVGNNVTVFFTLLGTIPSIPTSEPNVDQARQTLTDAINKGDYSVTVPLVDGSSTNLVFTATPNSLKSSKQYMSTHAAGRSIVEESYSGSAEAVAVIVGLIIGLIVGVIIAVAFRVVRKEPVVLPGSTVSLSNPLPSIRFQNQKQPAQEAKPAATEA